MGLLLVVAVVVVDTAAAFVAAAVVVMVVVAVAMAGALFWSSLIDCRCLGELTLLVSFSALC